MKNKILIVASFLLILISTGCSKDPIDIVPEEKQNDDFDTDETLDKAWLQVEANAQGIQSKFISEFVTEAAGRNWPQDRLRTALNNLSMLQIRNESNKYYGSFLGKKGDAIPPPASTSFDINNVIFCTTPLTLLRLKYYDKLNGDNKLLLDKIIDLALIAVRRDIDERRAAYTNTWLMRTWSLCGLGEALKDQTVLQEGRDALKEWMQNIREYGIIEYNSGVYTPISVTSLGYIANQITDAEIKRESNIALKYFSRTIFANAFSYDDRGWTLSGPQSRNYNFVHSRNGHDMICRMLNQSEQKFLNKHAAWTPFTEDLALYRKRPHLLVYKNGTTDSHYVTNYVGNNVSLGSAGTTYSSEDKTFVINFADNKRPAVVHISSVMDGRSDPYGEKLVSGKPRHLRYYLNARAQRETRDGSDVVFLLAADGSDRGDTDKLNHYVILPADRQDGLWNGNTQVTDMATGASQPLSSEDNQTVFIRFGNAVAGLRYLKVLDINESPVAAVNLVNIANKPQNISAGTAMYLQAKLSESTPSKGNYGVVAMWWRVKENITTEQQFETFRNETINAEVNFSQTGNTYTVKVNTPEGELGVSGNKESEQQTANYGGLTLPVDANFVVDGTDITPGIFANSSYFQ